MPNTRQTHWDKIYTEKSPEQVSWTQEIPKHSLEIIDGLALPKHAAIIDVGGGESHLVDHLLKRGYTDLSVLDISDKALERTQNRLGAEAKKVKWIQADINEFVPERNYQCWHDRAVFHFLTRKNEIQRYSEIVGNYVDQHLIISTFSKAGPTKCSGLPVKQYTADGLGEIFQTHYTPAQSVDDLHMTPFYTTQAFIYVHLKK